MKGSAVRRVFLDFFKEKGHTEVSSSSLVPTNDPTLLFTNAGMNQFKECFLGADKRAYVRAATCQKSMRVSGKHNDLENIGVTARHHTFFEMLGNFSFGDYFKSEAILFAWELITEKFKLPKSRLWVTIYEKDDEAEKLWSTLTDVLPGRIIRLGEKDNFWAMGDTGPCGPCTEIHYYLGDDEKAQSKDGFLKEDGSYLEIWNLVFMQFNRSADGTLVPLPKPSVDTGMGLERITSILQGVKSNYDTDLLRGIIGCAEELSGFRYDGSSYAVRDLKSDPAYARDVAMRVIADHSRAISFLIADGVTPGSDGRGYVLRRVLRRAVRHGRSLSFKAPFLAATCARVVELMGEAYPELVERKDLILKTVDAEERKFYETLDSGLSVLNKEAEKLKQGDLFSGDIAFQLHDTYGFPLDLTEDALKSHKIKVDTAAFQRAMNAQKARSREDRKSKGIVFSATKVAGPKSTFLGYGQTEAEAKLTFANVEKGDGNVGSFVTLTFDATPFYAESGGQVSDTGHIVFGDARCEVIDTQKVQDGYIVHTCEVTEGSILKSRVGQNAILQVDQNRRSQIRAHHSATHIVHGALRKFVGTHVKQAGSRVSEESLRFDYNHFEAVPESKLREIEEYSNNYIRQNYETITRELEVEAAKKTGAVALFGEKYGDIVRVVEIGPDSMEFCGGTHVSRSGEIGFLTIVSEGGISAGVRRIECVGAGAAYSQLLKVHDTVATMKTLLKSGDDQIAEKLEKVLLRQKSLERELEELRTKVAQASSSDLASSAKSISRGFKVIVERVDEADSDTLRAMVDRLRLKLGSGVVALAAPQGDSGVLVAGATSDLAASVHVGNLVKEASKVAGGRGGGRADFAQAGGLDSNKLTESLNRFFELVSKE